MSNDKGYDRVVQPIPDKNCKNCHGCGYIMVRRPDDTESRVRLCGCVRFAEVNEDQNSESTKKSADADKTNH